MQPTVLTPAATITTPAPNPFQAQFAALRQRAPQLRSEGVSERRARLAKLSGWLHAHRTDIQQALLTDFRKPTAETDLTEIWTSLVELKHTSSHLKK